MQAVRHWQTHGDWIGVGAKDVFASLPNEAGKR
jgi:hypothetical protein